MNDDDLKDQINELIRDEIQDVINEYVDTRDSTKQGGLGFVSNDDEGEFKVSISNDEVNKLIKEYKKIKKNQKSKTTSRFLTNEFIKEIA